MVRPSLSFVLYSIAFIVFGISLIWFLNNFKLVTEEVEVGYKGEAKYNKLFAAQKFIEKMGIASQSSRSMMQVSIDTLGTQDTVVLKQSQYYLAEFYVERMLYWVSQGGHLILDSYFIHPSDDKQQSVEDYFLHRLNVKQYERSIDYKEIKDQPPLQFHWQTSELEVDFYPQFDLVTADDFISDKEVKSSFGTHVLSFSYGSGQICVASDLNFITNDAIAKYDHAQFLWHLVNFERQPHKVWFILTSPDQFPSLYILLWKYAKWVVISAGILLLIWLWHISLRFGSILPKPEKARRRLLEHIEASGQFLWQQNQAGYLLQRTQQHTWQRLAVVHPQWLTLPSNDLSIQLSELTGIQASEILHAVQLAEQAPNSSHLSEINFTRAIQIFNVIRNVL